MSINFMKVHQPNMPHPDYIHKSLSKSKYAELGASSSTPASAASWTRSARSPIANNTLVFYTTDNGAWQDVYPDAGYTPFRGTKGTAARRRQPRSGDRLDAGQDRSQRQEP